MSFDVFWQCYPRRVAKLAAKKAYEKALKSATHEQIMVGVQGYAIYTRNTEHQFIKHPASWLNAGCWDDELPEVVNGNGSRTHQPRQDSPHQKLMRGFGV